MVTDSNATPLIITALMVAANPTTSFAIRSTPASFNAVQLGIMPSSWPRRLAPLSPFRVITAPLPLPT
eukprot:3331780-Pleurochrysis_carterae.AAC.1